MSSSKKYDIAIIGSGPGGCTAAIRAAQQGASVALIEKGQLGGVCLNVGCIPTKSYVAASHQLEKIKNSSYFGIEITDVKIDFKKIVDRKNANVGKLRDKLKNLLKANKIDVIKGEASFIDATNLLVKGKDQTKISASKIIIATGSIPLETQNLQFDCNIIHSSSSILNITKLPTSLVIIGGGYIGCEFASFFNALGTKVTIIEAQDTLLKGQDEDIVQSLEKDFSAKGIKIYKEKKVLNISKNQDSTVQIILDDKTSIKAEICLLSIGRELNLDNFLNLESINIEKNSDTGGIQVNEKMQTSNPNIYAIGDITGNWMLAHVASHEGIIAADNALGKNHIMKYDAIPSVIFTSIEIASCGYSEKCARAKNIDIETAKYPLSYLGKSIVSGETEGFVKIIIEKETKQIIGAHIFGHDASTQIAEMSVAITNELTIDCLLDTIHAHPTAPEAWMEASFLLNNTPIHYTPKK